MKQTMKIHETKRMRGNWEEFTGRFVGIIGSGARVIAFDLPGRGGRTTKSAARKIEKLWAEGLSVSEISQATGCECRGW